MTDAYLFMVLEYSSGEKISATHVNKKLADKRLIIKIKRQGDLKMDILQCFYFSQCIRVLHGWIADYSLLDETQMMWLGTGFKGKSELPGPTFCVLECSYTSCYRFLLSYLSDVNMEELALCSWARKQVFCGI